MIADLLNSCKCYVFDVDIKYFFVCMYMKYIVRCTIHVIINALRSKISMAYKIVNDLTDRSKCI